MKRVLIISAVTVAALLGVIYAIGAMLPQSHQVARSAHYDTSVESLWQTIYDNEKMAEWHEGTESAERLADSESGKEMWRFNTSDGGYMVIENIEVLENRRLVSRITETSYPFGGDWVFDLARDGDGAVLVLTEKGEIYSPFFRFVSRYIVGYDMAVEGFLKSVGAKYGQEVEIHELP